MISRLFWLLAQLGAGLLILVLVLGWFQYLHPAFDSLSHFRLVFCLPLAIAALVLLAGRKWRWGGVSLATIAMSLFLTSPYLPTETLKANATVSSDGTSVRIVQMNLRFNNPTPEKAVSVIRPSNPDIIFLQEVTLATQSVMRAFQESHPHQISCEIKGVGSVGILSKFPFSDKSSNSCARFFGFANATVDVNGKPLTLANFHSRWPWPRHQAKHIDALKDRIKTLKHPLIFAGDFNAAPWSAAVQGVAKLTNTRVAEGLIHSWAPRFLEFKTRIGPLLPIDQTLLSPRINLLNRTRLADGGSDHFPILSELAIP